MRFQKRERAAYNGKVDAFGKPAMWFSPDTSPMGATRKAFETIGMASVAKSAQEAKSIGYFRESDGITMNRDRLLYDAKQRALEMAKNYTAGEARGNSPSGRDRKNGAGYGGEGSPFLRQGNRL